MLNRALTLVLCWFLAEMLVMGLSDVLGAVSSLLPVGLASAPFLVLVLIGAVSTGLVYGLVGVLFSLWTRLPWREGGVWVAGGVTLLNLVNAGVLLGGFWRLLPYVVFGAPAAFAACWKVERDRHEPWVERARDVLSGIVPS